MADARRSALAGAAFLMATSAVGPGFLTQTAVFTAQLGASFGFVIAVSVLLDLAAQLTVWARARRRGLARRSGGRRGPAGRCWRGAVVSAGSPSNVASSRSGPGERQSGRPGREGGWCGSSARVVSSCWLAVAMKRLRGVR
jgi:hypothetical protein